MSHSHKSGWQKQTNKGHKQTFRSKRALDKDVGGKVNVGYTSTTRRNRAGSAVGSISGVSSLASQGRKNRANRNSMIRKNKRDAVLMNKRRGGGSSAKAKVEGAPRTVGIIFLNDSGRVPNVADLDEGTVISSSGVGHATKVYREEKFRVTYKVAARNALSVLDTAKTCDVLCFVLPLVDSRVSTGLSDLASVASAVSSSGSGRKSKNSSVLTTFFTESVDELGRQFMSLCLAQGLPSVVGVLQNLEMCQSKHQAAVRKHAANFFAEEFGESSKMVVDTPARTSMQDGGEREERALSLLRTQFLRALMEIPLKTINWRSERSYMCGLKAETVDANTLSVSGYLRGKPLHVNQLVHIPGMGNFNILKMYESPDPYALKRHKVLDGDRLIAVADPAKLPDMTEEAEPDLLAGDQTWPTMDEMREEEKQHLAMDEADNEKAKKKKKKKKKSHADFEQAEFQALWEEGLSDSDDSGDDEEESLDQDEQEELAEGLDEANTISLEEWRKKREKEQEELDYPDEVDTPTDIAAKERFKKYRGLKSFRTSPWHPMESLPREYARIFRLKHPKAIANEALGVAAERERAWLQQQLTAADNGMDVEGGDNMLSTCALPGQYITLHIVGENAGNVLHELESQSLPLNVGALLEHEHKLNVVNFLVQKNPEYEEPVKARELLNLSCGFWRRPIRPTFSEHSPGADKFKFERFLHHRQWVVASAYAPITFGASTPVLVFNSNNTDVVASGTVLDNNPDRIVLKKIVLSGHPIRTKKSWAVVRYMFFNPADIRYFKPIRLWTKYGREGVIREPLGTHGLFKCTFNKPINNADTVCMSLYKRIYPKPVNEFSDLQKEKEREKDVDMK